MFFLLLSLLVVVWLLLSLLLVLLASLKRVFTPTSACTRVDKAERSKGTR